MAEWLRTGLQIRKLARVCRFESCRQLHSKSGGLDSGLISLKRLFNSIIYYQFSPVAQWIRAPRYERGCRGFESFQDCHARVAQSVEHLVEAQGVGGSIPSSSTIILTRGNRVSRWVVAPEKVVRFYPSGPLAQNKYNNAQVDNL